MIFECEQLLMMHLQISYYKTLNKLCGISVFQKGIYLMTQTVLGTCL